MKKDKRYYTYRNNDDAPDWFVNLFAIVYVVFFALFILWVGIKIKTKIEQFEVQLTHSMSKYGENK